MTRTISVDLGSTNSGAAIYYDGRPRMIELSHGGAVTLPSVVTITEDAILVGPEAIEAGRQYPDYELRNFKRRLGEKWHQEEDTGFQTCEGPHNMTCFRGPNSTVYSPVELSSYILETIVAAANDFLAPEGETVDRVVLTVPAPFMPEQVEAAKEAARLAGIDNVVTLEEPIAAAIANGVNAKKTNCIVVVDFGGGTLDLSALRAGDGLIRVIAKNGIADLGGVDFDRRIADYVVNLWRTEHGTDLAVRDAAMVRIMNEAEAVKKRLSDRDKTEFRVENIDRTPDGVSQHMIYSIDRKIFDELTRDLRERMIFACKQLIEDVRKNDPKFSLSDIKTVLPVGGMTRVPAVRAMVSEFFGKELKKGENPEHVVAQGAAIWGAILDGRLPDITVAEVTTFDIALETVNNVPAIVVPRNTPYPLEKPLTLSNQTDEQTELSIRLLYATRSKAQDCSVIHAEEIGFEPVPAETLRLRMVLNIDETGQASIRRAA